MAWVEKKNDCHDRISFYLYCDSFFSSILSAQTHDTRRENKKTFAEKVHMLSFSLSFLKTPPLNSIMFVVQSSAASCHSILAGNLILSMCLERAQNSIELWRCRTLLTPFVLRQRESGTRHLDVREIVVCYYYNNNIFYLSIAVCVCVCAFTGKFY